MDIKKLKNIIENVLNSNKANNIISISLENKSFIADCVIIAAGPSARDPPPL